MHNQPDLVLLNGTIHTLDSRRPRVSALAIGDGKVLAIGDEAQALAETAAEVLDLQGAAVLPGLMDVHNHHMLAGQMALFELNEAPTLALDELLAKLAQWSTQLGPDEWIVGGSWGSGLLQELNSAEALARFDQASGGRPALIMDDSKHNRWANSRAMQLAGIVDSTADPAGGQIFRDASGKATGVLLEAGGVLVEQARERLQPMSTEKLSLAAAHGIKILHSYGITGFQDAATSLQLMRALKELDDQGELRAWVVTSMQANDFIFGTQPLGEGIISERDSARSEHHRPDFIKIFLDGVPPAGTGAFMEPYLDGVGFPECHRGHTTMDAAELEGWLMSTAERGISAKIHCTGDAAVRLVLDTVQKVREAGFENPKYHIAHGQFVHPDDISRFALLDVTADISPSLWFPGVIAEAMTTVLPPERASRMQPNKSLLEAGARIAGGSDWPVSVSPNVWEGVYGLITRQDPTGQFPGTLWAEQAITLDEAIRVYTINCAQAMGVAELTGSLEVGKSADFVVLSADPYAVETSLIPTITATQTWFAGSKVYDRAANLSIAAP